MSGIAAEGAALIDEEESGRTEPMRSFWGSRGQVRRGCVLAECVIQVVAAGYGSPFVGFDGESSATAEISAVGFGGLGLV